MDVVHLDDFGLWPYKGECASQLWHDVLDETLLRGLLLTGGTDVECVMRGYRCANIFVGAPMSDAADVPGMTLWLMTPMMLVFKTMPQEMQDANSDA